MTLLTDSLSSVVSAGIGLEILLGLALNTLVVVLLAVCVSLLLRKSAASARHLVWLLAVIATVAVPGMSVFVADFGWSPFRVDLSTMVAAAAPAGNAGALSHIEFSDRASKLPIRPNISQRPIMEHQVAAVNEVGPQTPPESSADELPAVPLVAAESVSLWTLGDLRYWSTIGFMCWAAGAAIVLALAIVGRLFLWRRRSSFCEVTDPQVLGLLDSVSAELALRRSVTLLESKTDLMPMTWGIVRPVLLLPVSAGCWSEERLRMIFLHELAHVKRFDCLWQVVSVVAMACHWFNPLVWLAVLRLRSECEQACDDVVISAGVPAADYGAQLLDISTGGRRKVLALCAGLALARPHRLTGRLEAVVDYSRHRNMLSRRAIGVSTITAALFIVFLSSVTHVTVEGADPQPSEQSAAERAIQDSSQKTEGGENVDQAQDLRFLRVGRRRFGDVKFPIQDFTFARIQYSSYLANQRHGGRWATDYPDADTAFSKRLAEWTSLKVNPVGVVKTFTDDDLGDYPFLYLCEPGSLVLSDHEVTSLRSYLTSGGFLMADDFWGEREWANVKAEIKRVFPDLEPVELTLNHRLFRWPFRLTEKPQVCSIALAMRGRQQGITWERSDGKQANYWGLVDDSKRLLAVFCHNTDLADGWERQDDDEWYAREFSEKRAFPMAMNIFTYAMTQPNPQRRAPVRVQQQVTERPPAGEQQIHETMLNSPAWLDLKSRLKSSGMEYRLVSVNDSGAIKLSLASSPTTDLTPLRGTQLTSLDLSNTPVVDLKPLAGMKLNRLDLSGSQVTDLSPLQGMPLEHLSLFITKVADLTPLADAKLTSLSAVSTRISDLSPLADQPLTYLDVRRTDVIDLTPLADVPLASLQLEETKVRDLRPLQQTPLTMLGLSWHDELDLGQLRGIPLTRLKLTGKGFNDVSALSEMKLESLDLVSTNVRDLSALKSMPLRDLNLRGTPAVDLTPLQNSELLNLYLSEPGIDFTAIKNVPLFFVAIPDPTTVKNFEILRSMKVRAIQPPNSKRVSAAVFWKNFDRTIQRQKNAPLSAALAATLISRLGNDDQDVRERAARRLETFGPQAKPAVDRLILSLNDPEAKVVVAVGDALESMGAAAVPALMDGLDHPDLYIRHRCAYALSNISPDRRDLVPRIATLLSDEHERVRTYAAISLGNLGPIAASTVPDLIKAMNEDEVQVRKFAIEALGKIGPAAKTAVQPLIKALDAVDGGVATYAEVALGLIGPHAEAAVPALIGKLRNRFHGSNVATALGRIGPPARAAVPELTRALNSNDERLRSRAAQAIRLISGEDSPDAAAN